MIKGEVKTGLISLIVITVLFSFIFNLNRHLRTKPTYPVQIIFNRAGGLRLRSDVKMGGVFVGKIKEIRLSPKQKAVVEVWINDYARIPRNSVWQIKESIIGERWIEISVGDKEAGMIPPGGVVWGEDFTNIGATFIKTKEKLTLMKEQLGALQVFLRKFNDKFANIPFKEKISEVKKNSFLLLTNINEFQYALQKEKAMIFSSFQLFAFKVERRKRAVASYINEWESLSNSFLNEEKSQLERTRQNIHSSFARFLGTINTIHNLAHNINMTAQELSRSGDMKYKVKKLKEQTQKLEVTLTNSLTKVKEFEASKESLSSRLHSFSENLNMIQDGIEKFGEIFSPPPSRTPPVRIKNELFFTGSKNGANLDFQLTLFKHKSSLWQVKVNDIDRNPTLSFQWGSHITPTTIFRGGIIKSSFGVGVDKYLTPWWNLSLDLWSIGENADLELINKFPVNEKLDIVIGVDNLRKEKEIKGGVNFKF